MQPSTAWPRWAKWKIEKIRRVTDPSACRRLGVTHAHQASEKMTHSVEMGKNNLTAV